MIIDKGNKILVRCYVKQDGTGKDIKISKTFDVPQDLTPAKRQKYIQRLADDFQSEVKNGEHTNDRITFKQAYEYWKDSYRLGLLNIKVTTYENTCDMIDGHAIKFFGNMKMQDIDSVSAQRFINGLVKDGLAPASIKRISAAVKGIFNQSMKRRIITVNPFNSELLDLPKIEQDDELHYFTVEQAKTFFKVIESPYVSTYKSHKSIVANTGGIIDVKEYQQVHKPNRKMVAFFYLAIYAGFRRGESCGLVWRNIDFDNCKITISQALARTKDGQIVKDPKTRSSSRTLKLPSKVFEVLRAWKQEQRSQALALGTYWQGKTGKDFDSNFIFTQDNGLPMRLESARLFMRRTIKRYNAGCENEDDRLPMIRLHDLRHTFATLLLAEGTDIMTVSHRLGHSNATVTAQVYCHFTEKADDKASETLERMFG